MGAEDNIYKHFTARGRAPRATKTRYDEGPLYDARGCRMKRWIALVAVALLGGCAVYTPKGSVVIDPAPRPSGSGDFCPPGQAKKGNC